MLDAVGTRVHARHDPFHESCSVLESIRLDDQPESSLAVSVFPGSELAAGDHLRVVQR
jgi:hypothetical protein